MENKSLKLSYSIPEAMIATGLGRTSIYQEIKEGKLVAKKYGSRTLVTAESLEDFINNLPKKENVGGRDEK